ESDHLGAAAMLPRRDVLDPTSPCLESGGALRQQVSPVIDARDARPGRRVAKDQRDDFRRYAEVGAEVGRDRMPESMDGPTRYFCPMELIGFRPEFRDES